MNRRPGRGEREAPDPLAELVDTGVALFAVNVLVFGPKGRLLRHAGHVFDKRPVDRGPADEVDPAAEALAEAASDRIRAWVATAARLRSFHELRLHLGGEMPDGFDPDRVVFEWKTDARPPVESVGVEAFIAGEGGFDDVVDYPHSALAELRASTAALVELTRDSAPLALKVQIQTRLLR